VARVDALFLGTPSLVQQVLTETVALLNDQDTISIVTYAGDTGVRLEPTPVSESGTIIAEIEGLAAGGSTAGAAGIDLAYQQAEAGFLEDGLNHIILCTDGDFNVGPSSVTPPWRYRRWTRLRRGRRDRP
jgi:Ca-activated chloride channel homolog